MKIFVFILVFLSSDLISPQSKHFIYFKDKGIEKGIVLEKGSDSYNLAFEQLSEKSIQRRIKHMSEQNFITYEDVPLNEDYLNQIILLGIEIENRLNWFNSISAYLTDEQVQQIISYSFVERIEPVKILVFNQPKALIAPSFKKPDNQNDFGYGQSFAQLQLSEIPIVHSKGITGDGVLLGLLDTGFDWKNHESLVNTNVLSEYDFVFKDSSTANDSSDHPTQHNHGTLVFSIVGGFKDSTLIGSAFGSDFILAKTEDVRSETHVEEDNYAAALEWMERNGVDITSSSLGYNIFPSEFSYTYRDMDGKTAIVTRAAELAFRRGVVTVTSAGNEGNNSWFYIISPADGFNTLGIGAVNNNNQVADFSSRGPTSDGRIKPDLVTQGVGVYCAQAGNNSGYINASGTSVAAPIASGIAALLLSAHPHLKNTQVRNILFETAASSKAPDFERGYGLISAVDAIEFPNLMEVEGSFKVIKMFLERENINPQTVKIHYTTSGDEYIEENMLFDGEYSYNFLFPSYLFSGDLVNFYLTYNDFNSNSFRDPFEDVYKFFYGQFNVQLNLDLIKEYTDFVISDPFPNPFVPATQVYTTIQIKSAGNENFSIVIIDALGQQVKKYSGITNAGTNEFTWFGDSENKISVSSGAYYLLIDLDGKKYSRSLILLR
ncbi:MAG: S8 family peptidase [Ignavibacteria bacterium]|nr:S8 family peptidase [Ignavibacteria bacterium]MBT8380913.1 S8 family peptidase [Ignavibacteria bacterium]MBT8391493.1 S8 family peptidase [Ignavibacteria bacterium]NNJ54156.1 S8 family serine peptidase [Ignavibacteriaceae bacterium]NNL20663.1 S8 family serine peptidase [Ignavibacteriaceae bacterium]